MELEEFRRRQREFQPRGMDLPQSKLTPLEVDAIRSAKRQRENLLKHIRENLTNEALAKAFGVHRRTVEKVLQGETWGHV